MATTEKKKRLTKWEKVTKLLEFQGEITMAHDLVEVAHKWFRQITPEEKEGVVDNLESFTERFIKIAQECLTQEYALQIKTFTHEDLDLLILLHESGVAKKMLSVEGKLTRLNNEVRAVVLSPYFKHHTPCKGGCKCRMQK